MSDQKLLSEAPLFSGLPSRTLKRIAAVTDIVEVPAGQDIAREGSNDRRFYVILAGEVDVTIRGRKRDRLTAGDFFGELAILNRSARAATVTGATDTTLAVIEARDFTALISSEPRIALHLLNAMARRFEWQARRPAGDLS